ncbi:MAG TPA: S41 family peptidase [Candidatus Atribacteria bacterium]|jgi:carboxyl-terminal processing protease|uniref:S41 family peptidase n=1 Tax=Candidatus Sordicultor fermentans TaxID=1953203 RepID=UPI0016AAB97E|nr:S41 family peptidase [Atribacterota bacterium]NLY06277.1 S41 family peptidase [Candidatus Atribacteria bacterium]HOA98498.1 S41 family peptidase [Candidatus Atribacteria bacterium]HPT63148.1 S41 family peptidase [Candidatus Atribacteria bacterium]
MRDKRIWLIGCLIALLALIVAWESWENKGAYGLGGTIDLEEWQPFFETLLLLQESFYSETPLEGRALMEEAIRGVLRATGDPYARYLNEEDYKVETSDRVEGEFSGLGIVIAIKDDKLTVISPFQGSPAEKAGIKAGDVIVEIDGVPALGMSSDEAVRRMRGERGTSVTLTIQREGEEENIVVEVVRDIIKIQSVEYEMLSGSIGLIRISEFHGRTQEELKKALSSLQVAGVEGLILDLRNNPGGLLQSAVLASGMFVPRGNPLLIVEDREGKRESITNFVDPVWKGPIVLVINKGTASGAEILAGVLRVHLGAELVGETTFGKGVVQEIFPLSHGGGVIFTVSKYLLPDGTDLNGKGLEPDILVSEEEEQIKKAEEELRRLIDEKALVS